MANNLDHEGIYGGSGNVPTKNPKKKQKWTLEDVLWILFVSAIVATALWQKLTY